jgi:hypothetical protein
MSGLFNQLNEIVYFVPNLVTEKGILNYDEIMYIYVIVCSFCSCLVVPWIRSPLCREAYVLGCGVTMMIIYLGMRSIIAFGTATIGYICMMCLDRNSQAIPACTIVLCVSSGIRIWLEYNDPGMGVGEVLMHLVCK